MIWYSGQTALFLFFLARAASAFLPTALSVALRPVFLFQKALFVQVFPLKPAPFCTLFAGLGSTNKSAISLLFSYYLTLALSSPLCFLLHLSFYLALWQEPSSLSSCSIRLQWVPGHSFIPENDAADELARRGALLAPSAIPCSLSPLNSRIHSRLISNWRRTVSSKFFGTQVPSISTEELVLPRHARCALSCLRCNEHSLLLGSYLSRISRIENPSCSARGHSNQDTSYFVLHCPATCSAPLTLWRLCVSVRPLVQTQESFPASGATWFPAMPPSLGRGWVINNNNNNMSNAIGSTWFAHPRTVVVLICCYRVYALLGAGNAAYSNVICFYSFDSTTGQAGALAGLATGGPAMDDSVAMGFRNLIQQLKNNDQMSIKPLTFLQLIFIRFPHFAQKDDQGRPMQQVSVSR